MVAVRSSSEGAAIQQASRREPRSVDFRVVQRTLNVGGIALPLSGVAGTPPAIAYLREQAEQPDVDDLSFRLLRFYASSVRHRKYYGINIVTVEVEGSQARAKPALG